MPVHMLGNEIGALVVGQIPADTLVNGEVAPVLLIFGGMGKLILGMGNLIFGELIFGGMGKLIFVRNLDLGVVRMWE
jgi:hypothetical protein